MKTTTYYEYRHRPGYGRDDHMADEIIARAADNLGCRGAQERILAHLGFVSHPVPMGTSTVRFECAPNMRQKMERALRAAFDTMRSNHWAHDCYIYVACIRERKVRAGTVVGDQILSRDAVVVERREGAKWVTERTCATAESR